MNSMLLSRRALLEMRCSPWRDLCWLHDLLALSEKKGCLWFKPMVANLQNKLKRKNVINRNCKRRKYKEFKMFSLNSYTTRHSWLLSWNSKAENIFVLLIVILNKSLKTKNISENWSVLMFCQYLRKVLHSVQTNKIWIRS